MRGRILEVPNLLDYTLLREPQRESSRMSIETDADEAAESATVQKSPGSARLAGCSSARGMESVAIVQDGTERFAAVQEAGSCYSSAGAVEGALVSGRESFNIGSVSSLIGMSEVGWISYLLLSN